MLDLQHNEKLFFHFVKFSTHFVDTGCMPPNSVSTGLSQSWYVLPYTPVEKSSTTMKKKIN